jgi:hypothetical protein
MNISPVLLYLWGALLFAFVALLVYRGQLTRYEDDQLFLDDDTFIVQKHKPQHDLLMRRLALIKPLLSTCGIAAGLVTTTVVGIYVYNAWQNIP